jgi:hypothetical protein
MQIEHEIIPQPVFANWETARVYAFQLANKYGASVIVPAGGSFRVLSAESAETCLDLAGECEILNEFVAGVRQRFH